MAMRGCFGGLGRGPSLSASRLRRNPGRSRARARPSRQRAERAVRGIARPSRPAFRPRPARPDRRRMADGDGELQRWRRRVDAPSMISPSNMVACGAWIASRSRIELGGLGFLSVSRRSARRSSRSARRGPRRAASSSSLVMACSWVSVERPSACAGMLQHRQQLHRLGRIERPARQATE